MKLAFLAAANSIHGIRWVKFFAGRGHDIVWISLAPQIPEARDLIRRVQFHEIRPSPLSDINGRFALCYLPFAVRHTKKILRSSAPDLLHVHSAGTYGLVGWLAGFHPTLLTPWGSDILLTSKLKKLLAQRVVRFADVYACDGENTKQKLIELGANPERIHLIRFGTDVEKFRPKTESRKQKIENRIKIISLRSLEPIYDIETLLRAAAIVVKEFSNVEFLIAGGGSERSRLEALAQELKLEHTVKFPGSIHNEALPALLQSADIYVSTALSDSGLSASTAEAMASGLPVVVTDSGDNRQWVIENKGGFVIPLRDPDALAEKIIYLSRNEVARKSFGEFNRRIIEEKNNYQIEMMKVEEIYKRYVARF